MVIDWKRQAKLHGNKEIASVKAKARAGKTGAGDIIAETAMALIGGLGHDK